MRTDRVAVIGAGVGGLISAIELARRGVDVTVIERAAGPGGKLREAAVDGVRIDVGPTVFTMRWVFDEIFAAAGSSLNAHLKLSPLTTLARHGWRGNERLDLFADLSRSADAIGAFAGSAEARRFLAFSAEARRVYEVLRKPFLEGDKPTPLSLSGRVGFDRFADLLAIRPFDTLWRALGGHFHDPRLRQLFARYATYCGSSPFSAPATLMLIAHVEQDGVWSIEGGMRQLARACEAVARGLGVAFRYDTHVRNIEIAQGRAGGLALDDGSREPFDAVVANADPAALAAGAFGSDVVMAGASSPRAARSLSAMTWAMTAEVEGPPLARHTVFFSDDYESEFDDLFKSRTIPSDPTVYVCAQDRDDVSASASSERLFLLINAPADGDSRTMTTEERVACETRVFDRLQKCGQTVRSRSAEMAMTTPADFHALFPATGGALYGRATHGWAGAFQRPGARTRIPGLYLAGGAAHPGAGVPMAALSGRLAASAVLADRASMRTSRRAATPGGMSTRSATTADTA